MGSRDNVFMKALILQKHNKISNNPLKEEKISIPEISSFELLIKVKKCGICHTDLHIVEGDLHPKLPIVPGHQIVGIVEKIGEKVENFKIGDRVGISWLNKTCKVCEYCKSGFENLCDKPSFTGFDVNGGFSEYVKSNEDFTFHLPENFNDEKLAPLLCAGIIGYRSFKLSGIREGENIGLFGFGASAHIVIQIANFYKCKTMVFTRSELHKKNALKYGAYWVGDSQDRPPILLDAAIIFAPLGKFYINALKMLKKGTTVVSAGIHMSPIPEFSYDLLYNEKKMSSVANYTRQDAKELLELAQNIPIKTNVEEFNFNEANKALQLLSEGKINQAGVLNIVN
jgi:propanol-preferring alcohol dehydrogenase